MTQDGRGTATAEAGPEPAGRGAATDVGEPAGGAGSSTEVDPVSPEIPGGGGTGVPRALPAPSAQQLFVSDTFETKTIRQLNKWAQGDLVPGVRLFCATPDGADAITGWHDDGSEAGSWTVQEYDEPAEGALPPSDSSGRRLGIITSQSCDIELTGVGACHPVVQVSPVVRAEDHFPNKLNEIKKRMIGYLVVLDNVPVSTDGTYDPDGEEPAEGTWVADLRISLPVSKAVMLQTKPRSAFKSDQAAMEFGEICAAKTRRPSWHADLAEKFPKEIAKAIEAARKERDEAWLGPVEQVRLELLAGTKVEPTKVAPVVLFDSDFPPEYRERWIEVLSEAGSKISRSIDVLTAKFHDINKMPAKDYRGTDPLPLPLGRPSYW